MPTFSEDKKSNLALMSAVVCFFFYNPCTSMVFPYSVHSFRSKMNMKSNQILVIYNMQVARFVTMTSGKHRKAVVQDSKFL